jgi:hypothetical protein
MYWFGILGVPFFVLGSVLLGFAVFEYSESLEGMVIVPSISFLVLATAFHFVLSGILAEYVISTGETDARSIIAVKTFQLGEGKV